MANPHEAYRSCATRLSGQPGPLARVPAIGDPGASTSTHGLPKIDPAASGATSRPHLLVVACPALVAMAGGRGLRATGDRARLATQTLSRALGPPQPAEAMASAPGAGSTMADSSQLGLAKASSRCRCPINPAPATAILILPMRGPSYDGSPQHHAFILASTPRMPDGLTISTKISNTKA